MYLQPFPEFSYINQWIRLIHTGFFCFTNEAWFISGVHIFRYPWKPRNTQWTAKESILSSSSLSSTAAICPVTFFKDEAYVFFQSHFSHKATHEPVSHPKYFSEIGAEHSARLLQINDLHFKQVSLVRLLHYYRMHSFLPFCICLRYYTCNLLLPTLKSSLCIAKYSFWKSIRFDYSCYQLQSIAIVNGKEINHGVV